MPESSTSSFIPKRGPGKKPSARTGNFILFSILSYALFVSAPLASAGVFIYERHTQNQFNKAVIALDQAIVSFNEGDLTRITEFNERLTTSKLLLESHASIVMLLQSIENSTAQTVKFKSLDITRTNKSTLTVKGILNTPNFDGALFQRSSYVASDVINNPLFTDVKLSQPKEIVSKSGSDSKKVVELKVSFNFATADMLYKPLVTEVVSPKSESSRVEELTSSIDETDKTANEATP